MTFKTLITNQVNSAFNLIQDLAEDIRFTNISVGSATTGGTQDYDFTTGEIVNNDGTPITPPTPVVIKGVISRMSKDVNDSTIITAEILLKTDNASANDLDNYDTINFRNKDWKINDLSDNGYVVSLNVARKV